MRKILLSLLLSCVAIVGRAQEDDYKPMLVDGRTWVCVTVKIENHGNDTIVKKVTYTPNSIPFLSEEGKQVFWNNNGQKLLAFDFGLNEGDNFPFTDLYGSTYTTRVSHVDTIEVKGKQYRRLSFSSLGSFYWVEGIGDSMYGPYSALVLNPMITNEIAIYVDAVYDGDECIFERQDFSRPAVTAIKDIESVHPSKNALYDLQGRHLSTKPSKGVYIENGKKWVVK